MKIFCWVVLLMNAVSAKEPGVIDLGVVGTVFPIKERNIMEVLQEKIASPMGKKLLHDFETRLKEAGDSKHYLPTPNTTLTPTTEHRTYLFNPSMSLDRDLADHNGTRFYQAGTKVNPLNQIILSKEYLFIDGDRSRQVAFALAYKKTKPAMIILVRGDPMRLMRASGVQVFFDQEEAMAKRFQLTHVPCSMAQEGVYLRITEWVEEDLGKEINISDQTSKEGVP
jgi:conjugal transfer pilus assembly protein TraW